MLHGKLMGKIALTVILLCMSSFAKAANRCELLFTPSLKNDYFQIDSSNMDSLDYLMLQHRRWQQRNQVEYYSKQQLVEFVKLAKKGDRTAIESLIASNIPLIIKEISTKVPKSSNYFMEYVSTTLIQVYKLIDRFDVSREDANFLEALKWTVKDVLKKNKRNQMPFGLSVNDFSRANDRVLPIMAKFRNQEIQPTPELIRKQYNQTYTDKLNREDTIHLIDLAKTISTQSKTTLNENDKSLDHNMGFKDLSLRANSANEAEVASIHKLIDKVFDALKENHLIEIFKLSYGVGGQKSLTNQEISDKLSISLSNVKYYIRDKIKPVLASIFKTSLINLDLLEQSIDSYKPKKLREQNQLINANKLSEILTELYNQFQNKKSPLEIVKKLLQIEKNILKSNNQELIFEYHYFLTEILLSAKKYELAIKKSQELLSIGKNWDKNHEQFLMLHLIAGKASYHAQQYQQAEKHLRNALIIKGAPYSAWFYYAQSLSHQNSSKNFQNTFRSYILYMTTLHRMHMLDHTLYTPKELDDYMTIKHLTEEAFTNINSLLKNGHGLNLISELDVFNYSMAVKNKDSAAIAKSLYPIYQALENIPKKRLKALNLEGPTIKAFYIYLFHLTTSLKDIGKTQDYKKVLRFSEEL